MCFGIKQLNLIIIGGPNSGKGSQSDEICLRYGIPHISTGDILRDNIARKTKLGLAAQSYMNKGELVPDDLVIALLKERIKQRDAKHGFLLDGFPRTVAQAEALGSICKITLIIYLEVPDEELIKRGLNRRVCDKCGKIYRADKLQGNKDCNCGGKLIIRSDDTEEALKKRLLSFHKQTEPVIMKYQFQQNKKGENILIRIDGTLPVDQVRDNITRELSESLQ